MVKRHFPSEILGERIVLRKHDLRSAPLMFSAVERDRERLRRYLPWVDFTATVDDEYAYVHQTHLQWDRHEFYDYSVWRLSDEAYMGNIGAHNLMWQARSCELGYWLLAEFEGHGIMTEAAALLIEAAFAIGFHRIEIRCSVANSPSAGVPRRLGFVQEARLRQATINLGRFEDTLVFGMLSNEWKNRSRR